MLKPLAQRNRQIAAPRLALRGSWEGCNRGGSSAAAAVDDLICGLGLEKTPEASRLLRELADDIGCGVLMAASDHASAAPSDRVWQFDRHKLVLMADHTTPKITPIHHAPKTERAARARRRR